MVILTLMYNSLILDSIVDIYMYNQCQLFTDFINSSTIILVITSAGVFPNWKTVILLLVLQNE